MNQFLKRALIVVAFLPATASADPSPKLLIQQKNSKCSVKGKSGEYSLYAVYRDGKAIYSPSSDNVVAALISPNGAYVALSAGESDLLDIENGKAEYGVVVVNCETGKLKGYRKGLPTLIKRWDAEKGIELSDYLNLSGNSGDKLP